MIETDPFRTMPVVSDFLKYDARLEGFRNTDFSRLEGEVYLDHAGSTLYPQRLLDVVMRDLSENVYGNPHSGSPSGQLTADCIDQVRVGVLQYFNTSPDKYSVVFTAGCTAALKLVIDAFDFTGTTEKTTEGQGEETGLFCFLDDNHTSVVGMREVAKAHRANVHCFTEEELCTVLEKGVMFEKGVKRHMCETKGNALFAYPAQSNFCGRRYPFDWIRQIRKLDFGNIDSTYVLLDAAAYVATSPLDLNSLDPDFVTVSFYKMFGFPTGLGALLVRNVSVCAIQEVYFGGGTVQVSMTTEGFHVKKSSISDRLEDGTVGFLDIIAVGHALTALRDITGDLANVSLHTFHLSQLLYQEMQACRHGNGTPVVEIYTDGGFDSPRSQGPILAFNVLKSTGECVGFSQVSKMAQVHNIHVRTGCFCNTGDCQRHLGLTTEDVKNNFRSGHVCGDDVDLINGRPTGAVRISLGYCSTLRDVQAFIDFIKKCFIEDQQKGTLVDLKSVIQVTSLTKSVLPHQNYKFPDAEDGVCNPRQRLREHKDDLLLQNVSLSCDEPDELTLTKICVYPVKSCGAFVTQSWKIGPRGLEYDREWLVVNEKGLTIVQRREPRLALIRPRIDLEKGRLVLSAQGMADIDVPLAPSRGQQLNLHKVCSDCVQGFDCGDAVASWFDVFLSSSSKYRLMRQNPDVLRPSQRTPRVGDAGSSLSFANEAQFLLVAESSVRALHDFMSERPDEDDADDTTVPDVNNLVARFRANFIVSGKCTPFEEERWSSVDVGRVRLNVQNACTRCQVICVDQTKNVHNKNLYTSLSAMKDRHVTFGVLLNQDSARGSCGAVLTVGDKVNPE